ncbi:hypothetical protein OG400_25480 [Micromonospora ureilytica]|uniref:hypothetical protein n=1 Tax=Micromonospora ureilytica TaxID=709868 RepID=UPI002E11BD6A|nr:hypothetical protein OG400_25480 [Micromonospora ureilytica]
MKLLRVAVAFVTIMAATLTLSGTAQATPREGNKATEAVREILNLNPGSRQISKDSVELEPGVIVSLPPTDGADMGTHLTCEWQWLCMWQNKGGGGYKIRFFDCDRWYYLENWRMPDNRDWRDKISSIHNAQSGGSKGRAEFVDTLGNGAWHTVGHVNTQDGRSDLSKDMSSDGRNWNDRIDKVWACAS